MGLYLCGGNNKLWVARRRAVRMRRLQTVKHVLLLEHLGVPRIRQRLSNFLRIRDGLQGRPFPADDREVCGTRRRDR